MIDLVYQLSILAKNYKHETNIYPTRAIIPEDKWEEMIKYYEGLGINRSVHESNGKKKIMGLRVEFGAALKVFENSS